MVRGDGNGWAWGPDGSRHWGIYGAAGLLLRAPLVDLSGPAVLLQHRAGWSHQGDTWALPGGARDSHESPRDAALREAMEEAGIEPASVQVRAERVTAVVGGWTYTTVVADTASMLTTVLNQESTEMRWVPEAAVAAMDLHPAFALAWPGLRAAAVRQADGAAPLPRTVDLGPRGFAWWY